MYVNTRFGVLSFVLSAWQRVIFGTQASALRQRVRSERLLPVVLDGWLVGAHVVHCHSRQNVSELGGNIAVFCLEENQICRLGTNSDIWLQRLDYES